MRINLNVMLIVIFVNSCIMKKKQYCAKLKLLEKTQYLKDKLTMGPDKFLQSEQFTKNNPSKDIEKYNCESKCLKLNLPFPDTTAYSFLNEPPVVELVGNQKLFKISKNKQTNIIDCSSENSVVKNNLNNYNIDEIYSNIVHYITKLQEKTDLKPYLLKLSNIFITYKFLDKNKCNNEKYSSFFKPFDQNFLELFDLTILKLNSEKYLAEKDCGNFIKDIDKKINLDTNLNELFKMKVDDKKLIFYSEFSMCVKYFADFSELLTIGRIFSNKLIDNQIVSIHLINLILKERKNDLLNRMFVLLLIKKAFTSSLKNNLDFYSIKMLQIGCLEDKNKLHQNNFHFFLWEMNYDKRNQLKRKLSCFNVFQWNIIEIVHFRSIVLMFLFQQMVLMRYSNASNNDLEEYFELIKSVINEGNKCPICYFDKYIEIIKMKYSEF